MGKRTTLGAENFTLGTGNVLAAFRTAAIGNNGCLVKITRIEISQNGSASLAMIRGSFGKRDAAGTLTMTANTPQPAIIGGAASFLTGNAAPAGGDARSGTNSSADTGGAYTDQHPFNFPNINGYLWKPDPNEELIVLPSTVFVVRLLATPGTTTGWTVAVDLDEM